MKKLHVILPAIASLLTFSAVNQVKAEPVVKPLPNGNYQVMAGECSVLFNSSGTLIEGGQKCDDVDLYNTKQAIKSYLAEQSGSGSEQPPSSSIATGETPERLYSTVPPKLKDLVGARAGQAEGELIKRGYTYRNTQTFEGGKSAYYIENSTGYCVEVGTVEGRYSSIVYNSSDRCAK